MFIGSPLMAFSVHCTYLLASVNCTVMYLFKVTVYVKNLNSWAVVGILIPGSLNVNWDQ